MAQFYSPEAAYDIPTAIRQERLTAADYQEIVQRLGRQPNRTELGMFGVMWSEHCCYRSSRSLLRDFPAKNSRVLVGPGENAGVIDLGRSQWLAFKIESHNHPSAIEPFQGAATGVGGILRDIFTMGARPIALLNALRFGPLEDPANIVLMEKVVAGIAHYGNCIGVPTVGGEVAFDKSYDGNPLVNAMALGLMETSKIVSSAASSPGSLVMYVGSTTGRDGMGGASFASAELSSASLKDRPAVQVGNPFLGKSLIEACLGVFQSENVIAAQDMGAAGLTCSCSEMAAKGRVGIELNLDCIPTRELDMTPYELLLSESQERMLLIVRFGHEESLMETFHYWGLQAAVVGCIIDAPIIRALHNGVVVAEIPAAALTDNTPTNDHVLLDQAPQELQELWSWTEDHLPDPDPDHDWSVDLLILLDDPTIASKSWIYRQYDQQVLSNTVIPAGTADAAVIRLRPQRGEASLQSTSRGVAATVDSPNRWSFLDPERGAIAAVAEAARNLSCVGAEPLAITDNLNFPSPDTPCGYWQLAMTCRGITKACQALGTPVTGGNVSLYNETRNSDGRLIPIHPTPVIGMVGLVEDLSKACKLSWQEDGDEIWLLGIPPDASSHDPRIGLAGSAYLQTVHSLLVGRPPSTDLGLECSVQLSLRRLIQTGLLQSAHDISDGGLAVAAAECCLTSGLGACLNLKAIGMRTDRLLFAEGGARVLVSLKPASVSRLKTAIDPGLVTKIGNVTKLTDLVIHHSGRPCLSLPVTSLREAYGNAIPRRMMRGNL